MVGFIRPRRLDFEALLRDGQLTLHYQPIVDLDTLAVRSVEALVRWTGPEPACSAGVLVRQATDDGLVEQLGIWALRTAVGRLADWRRATPAALSLSMAVNISPVHFERDDLPDLVQSTLEDFGVPAPCLTLEITEDLMLADTRRTNDLLAELKDRGVGIAIDDFGTGYSSLAYLQRFPVTEFKIDRCFVEGIPHRGNDAALVRSMLWLGQALGVSVVAEGVERQDQADELVDLGCRLAQGFLFSPPLPEDKILDILEDRGRVAQSRFEAGRLPYDDCPDEDEAS